MSCYVRDYAVKLIDHLEKEERKGIKCMAVLCYLMGIRDAKDGAGIDHVSANVKNILEG